MSRRCCCRACEARRGHVDRKPRRWALTDKGMAAISGPLPEQVDVPVLTWAALQLVAEENRGSR